MKWLIAIDPGRESGIAVFSLEDKTLHSLWYVCYPLVVPAGLLSYRNAEVVCEIPQRYSGSVVSKRSLLTLSYHAGYLTGQLRPARFTLVRPRDWKGQTPKTIDHARTRRILTPKENDILDRHLGQWPKSKQHNILDAVGIGLRYLDRRIVSR